MLKKARRPGLIPLIGGSLLTFVLGYFGIDAVNSPEVAAALEIFSKAVSGH